MGACLGAAFLAKLGAALIVAPALWLAIVAVKASWKRRVAHAIVAGLAFIAVALVWVGSTAVVPRSDRPYIGGSTDGTAWNLVVGYNGLGRITGSSDSGPGGGFPPSGFTGFPAGGVTGQPSGAGQGGVQFPTGAGGAGGFGGGLAFGGETGVGRLFNAGMGDQVMWLIAPSVATMLAAAWFGWRRRLSRTQVGSVVLFGTWAVVTRGLFS